MHSPSVRRDPVNGWIHFGAAVLAAVGLGVLIAAAARHDSPRALVGAAVFGASALLMFGASALYHLSPHSPRAGLLKRLDHAMIYVCIAGTYTPVCLIALRHTPLGTALLVAVWTLALAGIVGKLFWPHAPRGLSTALYVGLGWLGALAAPALIRTGMHALLAWLLVGGIIYTGGAMVYWKKWPRGRPGLFGSHELWHVCVIAASASHFWAVWSYVVPLA